MGIYSRYLKRKEHKIFWPLLELIVYLVIITSFGLANYQNIVNFLVG